jgi:hypothetical protein
MTNRRLRRRDPPLSRAIEKIRIRRDRLTVVCAESGLPGRRGQYRRAVTHILGLSGLTRTTVQAKVALAQPPEAVWGERSICTASRNGRQTSVHIYIYVRGAVARAGVV